MVSKKFIKVLKIITQKLKNQKIKWVLIGSTSLALQGVKVKQKDIDILTNKKDVFKINKLLKHYEIHPVKFGSFEIFESYFGEFKIENIKVEVIADLKVKLGNKWTSKRLPSQKTLEIDGMKITVLPLSEELKAYERLGRKKDFTKIKKIKLALKKESELS